MKLEAGRLLPPSSRGLVSGMIFAVWSAVVLLYAADYIFMRIPILGEFGRRYNPPTFPFQMFFYYGSHIWSGMTALSLLSLMVAFRNQGRRAWVAFNLCVLIVSVGVALLARQAAWTALEGIGAAV